MSTNAQCDYDSSTDSWLFAGGYGTDPNSPQGAMKVFDSLLLLNPRKIGAIAANHQLSDNAKLQAIQASIQIVQAAPAVPPFFFRVTGGALRRLVSPNSTVYLLMFGQDFPGNYSPFTHPPDGDYTNAIRFFRIAQNPLRVVSGGSLTVTPQGLNTDLPFHRRDLPVVNSVDPASGLPRITAFGGVFPPGKIAAYPYPIHVSLQNGGQLSYLIDRTAIKRFSQYQCPTVVVWDSEKKVVYSTFFGGIGHFFYHYDPFQKQVYDWVTTVGRNDGLPFTGDITTFLQRADGTSAEYIAPDPAPYNKLRGASVDFIPVPQASKWVQPNGVLNLQAIPPSSRVLIGYIYGGIEAMYPLPLIPSFGTLATNALYEVYLTRTQSAAIPAGAGYEATGVYAHPN
jgi:hypothetical protein